MKHMMFCMLASFMWITGCDSKPIDVTRDPSVGDFGAVIGAWRSKVPLRIVENRGTLYLALGDAIQASDSKLLSTLPIGTVIRIESLSYRKTFERSYLDVIGSLESGPYPDKKLTLSGKLFPEDMVYRAWLRYGSNKPSDVIWSVAPDKLERVGPETRPATDSAKGGPLAQ